MKRYILEIDDGLSAEAIIEELKGKLKTDIEGVRLSEIAEAGASFSCPGTGAGVDNASRGHVLCTDGAAVTASVSKLPDVRVQLAGGFEILVDGRVMGFERSKACELMALLVIRCGRPVTTREIAHALWPDEAYDTSVKNKVTRTVSSLKRSMGEAGIEDLLIKKWNQLALDTERIQYDEPV